jgi:hyperosmotically inducible protein
VKSLRLRSLAFLALLAATRLAVPSRALSQEPAVLLTNARAAALAGDRKAAIALYEKAARLAGSPEERARALLSMADFESGDRAKSLYQQALAAIPPAAGKDRYPTLRCRTSNNYGAFLVREKDTHAAAVLQSIEGEMRRAEYADVLSRYLLNLGQALELNGDATGAQTKYMEVLKRDAEPTRAADALYRLAERDAGTRGAAAVADLLGELLARGDDESAERYLHQALVKLDWVPDSTYAQRLLPALVRLLTEKSAGPETFAKSWKADLAPALAASPSSAAQRLARGIVSVYEGSLPVVVRAHQVSPSFFGWDATSAPVEQLSKLLKATGDAFYRVGAVQQALQRYSNAWSVDPENTDAAAYLSNLLLESGPTVDPSGALVNELVRGLFYQKGQAYLGKDWNNILRFHTVLGAIFERQGRWGSSGEPESAIFQWEHAVEAQRRLAGTAVAPQAVPGLEERLATAYDKTGRKQQAWSTYLAAANGYVALGKGDAIDRVLGSASKTGYTPSPAEAVHVDQIRVLAKDLERPASQPKAAVPRGDTDVMLDIKKQLGEDRHVKELPIEVKAKTGLVVLSGSVAETSQKSDVEALARSVAGVAEVKNEITVDPKTIRKTVHVEKEHDER